MLKQTIISIVIIISIFIGNTCTQNYTKESVDDITNHLEDLRDEIIVEEVNIDSSKEKIIKINDNWDERCEKLAYYIEHDELEKVKTELIGLKGYIEKEEYSEAIPELDKSIYLLKHIKDKNKFNLKNIF